MSHAQSGPLGLGLPRCPDCGGDMVGYKVEDAPSLLWSCRACGSTFSVGLTGELQPYPTELPWPLCPDCGADMLAQPGEGRGASRWRCPNCEFRLTI